MHPEQQYLNIVRQVIDNGHYKPNPHPPIPSQPNPPGTRFLIDLDMKFDLSNGQLPLQTTRRANFSYIVTELLWFLSGSTNIRDLQAAGNPIWDLWDSAETNGSLDLAPGEMGPIYGAQWRDFGGRVYMPGGVIHHVPGTDQISRLVEGLRSNPHGNRHKVVSWHPRDMDRCFVACCHGDFTCWVIDDRLDLHMTQRSADLPVGVPYNTASYSLLLLMLAQVTGLKPGTFHHTLEYAHVYDDQLHAMERLLQREPRPLPQISLRRPEETDIFAFRENDFELTGYDPHPFFKVPVTK